MITVAVVYFFLVFTTATPPTPPSAAALAPKHEITNGMWNDTKVLISNKNYVLILIIFTLIYTVYAGLGFIIDPLLTPYNYSSV
jgi:hypothetical protein